MRPVYKIYLYIVTFYYAVLTPIGSSNGDDNVGDAWNLIIGCVIHALIAASLFYFFDWPKNFFGISYSSSFGDLMLLVGLPVGLWVFIGFLHYPALMDVFKEDERIAKYKAEAPYREKRARIAVELEELRRMSHENPSKYTKMICSGILAFTGGYDPLDDYEVLKEEWFLAKEAKRLGIK